MTAVREPLTHRGHLIHCMDGWRAVLCVLDNLAPHVPDGSYGKGRRGFRWVCRLHDWAGGFGKYDGEEE